MGLLVRSSDDVRVIVSETRILISGTAGLFLNVEVLTHHNLKRMPANMWPATAHQDDAGERRCPLPELSITICANQAGKGLPGKSKGLPGKRLPGKGLAGGPSPSTPVLEEAS